MLLKNFVLLLLHIYISVLLEYMIHIYYSHLGTIFITDSFM